MRIGWMRDPMVAWCCPVSRSDRSSCPVRRLAVFLALLLVFSVSTVRAATYYVDSAGGNDGWDGTSEATAWKTIAKVNSSSFDPGDQVKFKRGGIWHEQLTIPSSGKAEAPIVFAAYGTGEAPLIDAATRVTGWVSQGGNIYMVSWPARPGVLIYRGTPRAGITTLRFAAPVPSGLAPGAVLLQMGPYTNLWVTSRELYTVSGITRFTIREDVDVRVRQLDADGREQQWATPLGKPTIAAATAGLTRPGHWYWDAGTLFLYSDVDPDTITVEVSSFDVGIHSNGKDYLVIRDLRVRGAGGIGVFLSNSDGVTVSGVEVTATGLAPHQAGIQIISSSGSRVENCTVRSVLGGGLSIYAWGGPAANNVITGNTFDWLGSAGISLSTDGGGQSAPSLVTGNVIENNTILHANQLTYDAGGIYTLFSGSGNVIRGNIIRDGGSVRLRSAGIMVDQGSGALRIENNEISGNSNGGIAVASAGHTITGNRIYNNGVSSWTTAQIVFFPVDAGHTAANCTVRANYVSAGPVQNLFYVQPGATTGHTIDGNEYFDGAPLPFLWNVWTGPGTDFAGWRAATGQDGTSSYLRTSVPRPPADFRVISGAYLLLL